MIFQKLVIFALFRSFKRNKVIFEISPNSCTKKNNRASWMRATARITFNQALKTKKKIPFDTTGVIFSKCIWFWYYMKSKYDPHSLIIKTYQYHFILTSQWLLMTCRWFNYVSTLRMLPMIHRICPLRTLFITSRCRLIWLAPLMSATAHITVNQALKNKKNDCNIFKNIERTIFQTFSGIFKAFAEKVNVYWLINLLPPVCSHAIHIRLIFVACVRIVWINKE